MAREIADFQKDIGRNKPVLSLYDYILAAYATLRDIDDIGDAERRKSLLQEMVAISKKSRLPVRLKAYKKSLAKVEDELAKKIQAKRKQDEQKELEFMANDARRINTIDVTTIEANHRSLVENIKWSYPRQCAQSDKHRDLIEQIVNGSIRIEKSLHPRGHEHVLDAFVVLIECYKEIKDTKNMDRIFKQALKYYLQADKNKTLDMSFSVGFAYKLRSISENLYNHSQPGTYNRHRLILYSIILKHQKELGRVENAIHTLRILAFVYEGMGDAANARKCFAERVSLLPQLERKQTESYYKQVKRHPAIYNKY